jgi:hypothetical protein
MRRGHFFTLVVAAFAALVLSASALAASPRQIYSDLADNGKLDNTYSSADLQNAALDASVQGYGGVEVVTLRPVVEQQAATPPAASAPAAPATSGVAGVQKTVARPAARPAASTAGAPLGTTKTNATGTLPFTGMQVGLFVAIGLALLGSGLLLRRSARASDSA